MRILFNAHRVGMEKPGFEIFPDWHQNMVLLDVPCDADRAWLDQVKVAGGTSGDPVWLAGLGATVDTVHGWAGCVEQPASVVMRCVV